MGPTVIFPFPNSLNPCCSPQPHNGLTLNGLKRQHASPKYSSLSLSLSTCWALSINFTSFNVLPPPSLPPSLFVGSFFFVSYGYGNQDVNCRKNDDEEGFPGTRAPRHLVRLEACHHPLRLSLHLRSTQTPLQIRFLFPCFFLLSLEISNFSRQLPIRWSSQDSLPFPRSQRPSSRFSLGHLLRGISSIFSSFLGFVFSENDWNEVVWQNAQVSNFSIFIHPAPGFEFDESTTRSHFFYGRQLKNSIQVFSMTMTNSKPALWFY